MDDFPDDNITPILLLDLEELAEYSTLAIVSADSEGKIFGWNQGCVALFGWLKHQALGQKVDIIIPERFRQQHWEAYEKATLQEVDVQGFIRADLDALHKDGHEFIIGKTKLISWSFNRQMFFTSVFYPQ